MFVYDRPSPDTFDISRIPPVQRIIGEVYVGTIPYLFLLEGSVTSAHDVYLDLRYLLLTGIPEVDPVPEESWTDSTVLGLLILHKRERKFKK